MFGSNTRAMGRVLYVVYRNIKRYEKHLVYHIATLSTVRAAEVSAGCLHRRHLLLLTGGAYDFFRCVE